MVTGALFSNRGSFIHFYRKKYIYASVNLIIIAWYNDLALIRNHDITWTVVIFNETFRNTLRSKYDYILPRKYDWIAFMC